MIKILKNSGPWGSWNGDNNQKPTGNKPNNPTKGNNAGNGRGNQPQSTKDPIDEIIKEATNFLKSLFGSDSNGGKSPGGKTPNDQSPKSIVGLTVLVISFLWLASGFYQVDTDENAVLLYFGKFYKVTTPGLNYHIPYPFGKVIKASVTSVNTEEFGFSSNSRRSANRDFDSESLMLTGDENIVDIEFQVQWQIADIKNYAFNIVNPNLSIRKSAESAMRAIIARTPIANALSDGKGEIEQESKVLLQEILDSYGAGVRIVLVQLRKVDPPEQVIDAFRDVQTAKADKEKEINQAEAYSNDIIPRARGEAAQAKERSEAYAQSVVAKAEGEAGRFNAVHRQYVKAKRVTKKRMYLETMEGIYSDMDKVFIDKSAGKGGVVPYFPLNEMRQPAQK